MNLEQLKSKLEAKSQELSVAVAGDNIDEIKTLTEEVNTLKSEVEVKSAAMEAVNVLPVVETKNMNENIETSRAQAILNGKSITIDLTELEGKTMLTSSGVPAQAPYTGPMFAPAQPGSGLYDAVEKFNAVSANEEHLVAATYVNGFGFAGEGVGLGTGTMQLTYTSTNLDARQNLVNIPVSETSLNSMATGQFEAVQKQVLDAWKARVDYEVINGTKIGRSLTSVVGVGNTFTTSGLGIGLGTGSTPLDYRTSIDNLAASIEAVNLVPAYVVAHPRSAAKIANQKDDNNAFVWQSQGDWKTYNGMRLIKSANCSESYVWVISADALKLGILGGNISVDRGYASGDFESGRVTLRCRGDVGAVINPAGVYRLELV